MIPLIQVSSFQCWLNPQIMSQNYGQKNQLVLGSIVTKWMVYNGKSYKNGDLGVLYPYFRKPRTIFQRFLGEIGEIWAGGLALSRRHWQSAQPKCCLCNRTSSPFTYSLWTEFNMEAKMLDMENDFPHFDMDENLVSVLEFCGCDSHLLACLKIGYTPKVQISYGENDDI